MQRFYTTEQLGTKLTLRDPNAHHQISRVLRMQKGDQCIFFSGNFVDEIYEIETITKSEIILVHKDSIQKTKSSDVQITLCQALPNKIEKLEYIIQKCTEVWVEKFIFFHADRSQPLALLEKKKPRLLEIAKEAVEQCGGDTIPEIFFEPKMPKLEIPSFVTDTHESPAFWSMIDQQLKECTIFIGPEGGWSDAELKIFSERKTVSISLGSRILRTETAGVCAAFLAKNIRK